MVIKYDISRIKEYGQVRVSSIEAKRGEILDRNNVKLAENGTISSIGIVPGKFNDNKEENVAKLSEVTGVSEDYINTPIICIICGR